MRRAAKVDRNQAEIVKALRAIGASVQTLHTVGQGVPDLLVGWKSQTHLLEVKRLEGKRAPKAAAKTIDQIAWHHSWRGRAVAIVSTVNEALIAIGAHCVDPY
jgi:hypothetical protein